MKKLSRRNFIGDTDKAAVPGIFILSAYYQPGKEMKKVFIYHVYFWLQHEESTEDLDKLVVGLKKLSAVTTIRQFHIGKPAATSRDVIDGSYTLSWLVLFDNKSDQDSYQTDPIHLKFIEDCSLLWQKVVVYDAVDIE
ncbi:MAG: Dabb family protein [Bacteroidota bacterium]|nr:Dabb family protein [Bacteroidota bacterium]